MMTFQPTPTDISVIITSAGNSNNSKEPGFLTERRITPTWTVNQLKAKLETMTGVPPGSQRLQLKSPGRPNQWVDGDEAVIGSWGLMKGSEIEVHDMRPAAARPNFTDLSAVNKYVLPESTYETLPNSVLAWKKNQKLGRFDPTAVPPKEAMQRQADQDRTDVQKRGEMRNLIYYYCQGGCIVTRIQTLPFRSGLSYSPHPRRIFGAGLSVSLGQCQRFPSRG